MKKIYSFFLLLGLLLSVGNAWGDVVTGTINFGSGAGCTKINAASVTGNDDLGNSWTITTVGTTSYTANSAYYQVGSSSKPATSITFTTTLPESQTITSFSAKFGGFSNTAGNIALKVGDTTVGSGSLNATSDVVVSSNTTAAGTVLTVTVTGIAKGVKCYYVSYSYNSTQSTTATPEFSPAGGVYTSAQQVTLSCETDGATIYYTTDGSDPTNASTEYTGTINVAASTMIKAIAMKDGYNNSTLATATYVILQHAGTQADPYTVADARAAIDCSTGITNVYVSGIVCEGGSSLSSGQMNYWISDDGTENNKLEAYKGKNLNNTSFSSTSDVQVGDIVTIFGSLTKYNSTYEFSAGNYLISHQQPVASPIINAENVNIAADVTSGEIAFTISNPAQEVVLQASLTSGDWISNVAVDTENNKVTFSATANTGDERQATITLTYTGASPKVVTVTQAPYIAPQTFYALVTQYDGNYYAVDGSSCAGGTYGAIEVDVVNGKLVTPQTDALSWAITTAQSAASIQSKATGKYIGWSSSTTLTQSAEDYGWVVDDVNSSWTTGSGTIRSIVYREIANGFKAYSIANIGAEGYANTYTTAYAFSDGYVRSGITGTWGTICLPSTVEAEDLAGATFYSIVGKVLNAQSEPVSLVLEEENDGLIGGYPYIFEMDDETTKIVAAYQNDNEAATSNNGLVGTLTAISVDAPYYMISGDAVVNAVTGSTLPANRAYIDMANVPVYNPSNAPERIVTIALGGNGATNIMNVDDVESAVKFIENGKLFIKKNGVIYNAVGAIVK